MPPDGLRLIFTRPTRHERRCDAADAHGTRRVEPLVQTRFVERNGGVSPDGRWLAYEANDAGSFEIYVRPFPDVSGGQWQVSSAGGIRPLWARSGQELFYVAPTGALMRSVVERGAVMGGDNADASVKEGYLIPQFHVRAAAYDISPDGQRFLMIKDGSGADAAAAPRNLIVVLNWVEELKRLVPTK